MKRFCSLLAVSAIALACTGCEAIPNTEDSAEQSSVDFTLNGQGDYSDDLANLDADALMSEDIQDDLGLNGDEPNLQSIDDILGEPVDNSADNAGDTDTEQIMQINEENGQEDSEDNSGDSSVSSEDEELLSTLTTMVDESAEPVIEDKQEEPEPVETVQQPAPIKTPNTGIFR